MTSVSVRARSSCRDTSSHTNGSVEQQLLSHLRSTETAVTGAVDEYVERRQRVLARTRARHDGESKLLVQSLEDRRVSFAGSEHRREELNLTASDHSAILGT